MNEPGDLAVVLAGGGARAAYQVGALVGIAERVGSDFHFPIVTGVSAGAINASYVASHAGPFETTVSTLAQAWLGLSSQSVFRADAIPLLGGMFRWAIGLMSGGATSGVLDTAPLRKTLTRFMRRGGIEENLASGRLRALALSTTSYATGRTVTFVQGASDLPSWRRSGRIAVNAPIVEDHVLASSALPLLFPAVAIGNEYFGDGSVRQTAPLAPAIHLGARRLLAISIRYSVGDRPDPGPDAVAYPPPAQILGMLMNAIFLDAMDADAERLDRVNRSLELLPPDRPHPDGLRKLRLAVLRPSENLGQLAAGLDRHLPPALRYLVRGLGSTRIKSQDMLSYLLFERPYIERLLELGRADVLAQWDRIGPLLDG
jgi:NTE family protein